MKCCLYEIMIGATWLDERDLQDQKEHWPSIKIQDRISSKRTLGRWWRSGSNIQIPLRIKIGDQVIHIIKIINQKWILDCPKNRIIN